MSGSIKGAPFLTAPESQRVMTALMQNGGDARFVGGAVRNCVMGIPVTDIDIATPLLPEEVVRRLQAGGMAAHPTGIDHGTITAVANHKTFEITTLRKDVTTDGRRATVAFTADWKDDASRRDFTMNALYADIDGNVTDYFGGVDDARAGRVRFIGDAGTRLAEDHLRILRFFRFHAWYGKGELDETGLAACVRAKEKIDALSGERIHKEILRLLEADDPVKVMRVMAATGIIAHVLPGPLEFARGTRLVEIERDQLFTCDPLLRLGAFLGGGARQIDELAARLKFSNAERGRLLDMQIANPRIVPYLSMREVRRALYRIGQQAFKDLCMLRWAEDPRERNAPQWRALIAMADSWQKPVMPLTGHDAMNAGVPPGPEVGRVLAEVEEWWIDSDFTDDPFSLIERLKAVVLATVR
ncbi:MAG TPA: CCA tRNA nucleotidyltransferase [Micropepsaceae bacterium]|nr:CCA tRNA nucleotidyltransferase [Micropepsaceae bacterium]